MFHPQTSPHPPSKEQLNPITLQQGHSGTTDTDSLWNCRQVITSKVVQLLSRAARRIQPGAPKAALVLLGIPAALGEHWLRVFPNDQSWLEESLLGRPSGDGSRLSSHPQYLTATRIGVLNVNDFQDPGGYPSITVIYISLKKTPWQTTRCYRITRNEWWMSCGKSQPCHLVSLFYLYHQVWWAQFRDTPPRPRPPHSTVRSGSVQCSFLATDIVRRQDGFHKSCQPINL